MKLKYKDYVKYEANKTEEECKVNVQRPRQIRGKQRKKNVKLKYIDGAKYEQTEGKKKYMKLKYKDYTVKYEQTERQKNVRLKYIDDAKYASKLNGRIM